MVYTAFEPLQPDAGVRKAKEDGWRARSAFKLLQIDQAFHIFEGEIASHMALSLKPDGMRLQRHVQPDSVQGVQGRVPCRGAPRGRPLCSAWILVPGNPLLQQIAHGLHLPVFFGLGRRNKINMTVLQTMQCACSAGVVARAVPTTSEGWQARSLL